MRPASLLVVVILMCLLSFSIVKAQTTLFSDDFEDAGFYTYPDDGGAGAGGTFHNAFYGRYDVGQDASPAGRPVLVAVDPTDATNHVLISYAEPGDIQNLAIVLARAQLGHENDPGWPTFAAELTDYVFTYRIYSAVPGGYDLGTINRQTIPGCLKMKILFKYLPNE